MNRETGEMNPKKLKLNFRNIYLTQKGKKKYKTNRGTVSKIHAASNCRGLL